MTKVTPIKLPPSPLMLLQQKFCLVKMAGEIWVIERPVAASSGSSIGAPELQFYKIPAARVLMGRYLETVADKSDPKRLIDQFLISPSTTLYDHIAFSPLPTPSTTLNLWRGCPITPARGDWLIVQRFLLEVICAGDISMYRYLILFLSHMIQKPEDKPGIMIVLLGGQGIGKGGFFRLLSAIWPETSLLVSDISHVLGQFNAELERSYVLCMDEALFVGDKRSGDRLKSFVTEPTVTIEQKFQPRRTIESFHRLFAASNHAHFAKVDADDRRFLFLRVSEVKMGDYSFWEQYHAAVADPAILAAIVHDLQTYDIAAFNPRVRPKTAAHVDQKIRSLSGFDRYWYEVLSSGAIDVENLFLSELTWDGAPFVSTQRLTKAWQAYDKHGRHQFSTSQERDLHEVIARLCPSATRKRKVTDGCQQRGYDLPLLPRARAEFDDFIGGGTEWDD